MDGHITPNEEFYRNQGTFLIAYVDQLVVNNVSDSIHTAMYKSSDKGKENAMLVEKL